MVRWTVFNRVTVPWFWIPLLRSAERHRPVAWLVNGYLYRGTVFYHFLKGCHDRAGLRQLRPSPVLSGEI